MNRVLRLADFTADAEAIPEEEAPFLRNLNPEHLRMLEALLFPAAEPLDEAALGRSLPQGADLPELLEELQQIYETRGVN
ncbi:MAG TPA: hypothetical protein VGF62_09670, partial [Rhizomicrobium sp.]